MRRLSPERRLDLILLAVGIALGTAAAAAYGLFRAFTLDDPTTGDRLAEFGEAMFFPGLLVIVSVAAMVWLGWKANIDD